MMFVFINVISSLIIKRYKIEKIRTINTNKLTYISIKNSHLKSENNYLRAMGEIAAILKIRSFFAKLSNFFILGASKLKSLRSILLTLDSVIKLKPFFF